MSVHNPQHNGVLGVDSSIDLFSSPSSNRVEIELRRYFLVGVDPSDWNNENITKSLYSHPFSGTHFEWDMAKDS